MIREIEFRGKRIIDDTWIYGGYIKTHRTNKSLIGGTSRFCQIKPETLGQYTGLKDKNGTKIFEGDVVKVGNVIYTIDFGFHYSIGSDTYDYGRAYGFFFANETYKYSIDDETDTDIEVIGNIYDNPELIKE